ncbi:MAG: hypothetical protein HC800_15845 [Phormidesmis sp. RL_2_1]|nr:hypothetical protein [Phormidesmis sp. RL_2_1]
MGLAVATVVIISLLLVGQQILTERSLRQQSIDIVVMDIAGQQRMLSQKIAKTAYALRNAYREADSFQRAPNSNSERGTPPMEGFHISTTKPQKDELTQALILFQQAHVGLQSGSAELHLPGGSSPTVAALFADVEPEYEALVEAATIVASPFQEENSAAIRTISKTEEVFLKGMSAIVDQYEQEAISRVNRLKTVQRLLLWLSLLVPLAVIAVSYQVIYRSDHSAVDRVDYRVHSGVHSGLHSGVHSGQAEAMMTGLDHKVADVIAQVGQTQEIAIAADQALLAMALTRTQIKRTTGDVAKRLGIICDRANNIAQAVFSLTTIVEQINLLSLNTAPADEPCESSRADFTDVTPTMRQIVHQSAIASLEIEGLIKEIQTSISTGIVDINRVTQQVSVGTEQTALAIEKVATIIQQTKFLWLQLSQIKAAITFQPLNMQQNQQSFTPPSTGTQPTTNTRQRTHG